MERAPGKDAVAAVGAVTHYGRAVLVTVSARDGVPFVADRRQVVLIGDGLPSAPYHHEAQTLARPAAAELIRRVRAAVDARAEAALAELRRSVRAQCRLGWLAHRAPRPLPETLDGILDSRPATLIAAAEMYLAALSSAAGRCRLPVVTCARGTELEAAARALGADAAEVAAFLAGMRASLGPPWQADHRTAAAAALAAAAGRQGWRLPGA